MISKNQRLDYKEQNIKDLKVLLMRFFELIMAVWVLIFTLGMGLEQTFISRFIIPLSTLCIVVGLVFLKIKKLEILYLIGIFSYLFDQIFNYGSNFQVASYWIKHIFFISTSSMIGYFLLGVLLSAVMFGLLWFLLKSKIIQSTLAIGILFNLFIAVILVVGSLDQTMIVVQSNAFLFWNSKFGEFIFSFIVGSPVIYWISYLINNK